MLILRIVVFVVGAYISTKSVRGTFFNPICEFFLIGLIFGVVVIVWQWSLARELQWNRGVGFFLASTFIYMFVIILPELDISETVFSFIIQNPMCLGTILLPLAHKLILKTSWLRIAVTIPSVFALTFAGGALFQWLSLGDFINIITIWQGTYLAFMFYPYDSGKSPH